MSFLGKISETRGGSHSKQSVRSQSVETKVKMERLVLAHPEVAGSGQMVLWA